MAAISGVLDGRTWWRLGRDGWRAVLRSTAKEFSEDEVSNLAAVVTLRIVLALVPSMIAAVAIAATVLEPSDIESFVDAAGDVIPESSRDFVTLQLQDILESLGSGGIGLVGVLAGIFAATSAAAALMGSLNKAYGVTEQRSFLAKRTGALVVLGALVLALAGMFVSIVLGPSILAVLLPERILESPIRFLITIGRYLAGITVLILFFGFTYWFAPHRDKPRLRLLTPGAVLGVVGWLVLSYLFSVYTRVSGSYSATYGIFAGIIVLLVWLNYSFTVLIMGAELDNEIEKHLRDRGVLTGGADAPSPVAAGSPVDVQVSRTDLDQVDEGMPRDPRLVGAARDAAGPVAEDEGSTTSLSPPVLMGAAANTSGAGIAKRLWRRMER